MFFSFLGMLLVAEKFFSFSHNVQETSHYSTIEIRHLSGLQPVRKIRTDICSHQFGTLFFNTYIHFIEFSLYVLHMHI